MKVCKDKSKWMLAPIDGKNVELDNFSFLEYDWNICSNRNDSRFAMYRDERNSGLIEIEVGVHKITICNIGASKGDFERLISEIADPINEEQGTDLFAEVDKCEDKAYITFYWTDVD